MTCTKSFDIDSIVPVPLKGATPNPSPLAARGLQVATWQVQCNLPMPCGTVQVESNPLTFLCCTKSRGTAGTIGRKLP